MGSSIEAAITISAIILILTFFIILPIGTFVDAFEITKSSVEDLEEISEGFSPEELTTLLTGVKENFKILAGGN